ncbi:MAG: cholesterol esterase [Micromonosporaceae bacterium]|nr:cholesterol esterase [Micromonosporaceae bacterium]
MSDSHKTPVRGRTRWRRSAALLVPAFVTMGGIIFGLAHGAIAAQITVSGQPFKVSATQLDGTGFVQYGNIDLQGHATDGSGSVPPGFTGAKPVAISAISSADLTDLCQTVRIDGPGGLANIVFGGLVIKLTAGDAGQRVHATDLRIDLNQLSGDATFDHMKIGLDANSLGLDEFGTDFAQTADEVHISNLQQTAYYTEAGTFTLPNLHLAVLTGSDAKECF